MPKFAANITTMYQEMDLPLRFKAAANDGFTAIELLNPYAHSTSEIRSWLDENGLELILINTRPGLSHDNTVGLAALPGREEDFRQIFSEARDYALALRVNMIHVLAGVVTNLDKEDVATTLRRNLRWAATELEGSNINIMLEPLNDQDVPGYIYTSSRTVADLIDELALTNIKLQYDLYHMQIMEGNLAKHLAQHLEKVGHVQFSSVPGRHEPQFGEVNVDRIFTQLDDLGYEGWIGCEYTAKNLTSEGLGWGHAYGLGITHQ